MLLVPYLVGVVRAGPSWAQVPLLVAWLAGYLLSYYVLLAIKTRRVSRVRRQLLTYAGLTVPAGLVAVVLRPELLTFAPVYAVLLGVNVWYAWHRSERGLVNGLASVVQGCLMVPVAAGAAGVVPLAVLEPFLLVLMYFVGTMLFVKTMVRKRGDERYFRASVAYHAVVVVAAGLIAWPLTGLFGWFLVRAVWLPHRKMTPKGVGMIEIANCVALLIAVIVLPS